MSWFYSGSTQYAAPTTGQTVTCSAGINNLTLVVDPAGPLAALTITLPSAPVDAQSVRIIPTQAVTVLTVSGGTLGTALSALVAGSSYTRTYCASQSKWY